MTWLSTFRELRRPLVIAHGGASSTEPDNTMAAFRAAVRYADAIEMDVRLTSDGVSVCLHDELVPLDNGSAIPVGQITWSDLQQVRPMTPTLEAACVGGSLIFLDIKE